MIDTSNGHDLLIKKAMFYMFVDHHHNACICVDVACHFVFLCNVIKSHTDFKITGDDSSCTEWCSVNTYENEIQYSSYWSASGPLLAHCRLATRHSIKVTSWWAWWRLESPASWLFAQAFVQAQINENIKAPRHWPFLRGIHHWPVDSLTKGQLRGKCFHLMTSSCLAEIYWAHICQ